MMRVSAHPPILKRAGRDRGGGQRAARARAQAAP